MHRAAGPTPRERSFAQRARVGPVTLWLITATILVALHFDFYFRTPCYEGGDFAANALQIRDAKQLNEIHGNYSRWGFNHPGPAFFYVYAVGEAVLFDTIRLVPAPYNAHAVTGALLQAAFFTCAIWIVARRAGRPLALPLALLFAALHFGVVNHFLPNTAFQSIWPPHVLLMPFLCLLVAAASVASGESRDLMPLVIAGGFLVHGHAAQPLFVLPLAALAYAAWWWNSGAPRASTAGDSPRGAAIRLHLIAALTLAIFLLPIAIDAARGEASNLRAIVTHFTSHAADRKTLTQSALYFVTFMCHVTDPEKFCDQLSPASVTFLRLRWYFVATWIAIAVATVVVLTINHRRRRLADPGFTCWLAVCLAAGSSLTVIWGMLQHGPMFGFNSYFNFAILFLPLLLLAIALASLADDGAHPVLDGCAWAVALPLLFFASRNFSFAPDFPTQPLFTPTLNNHIRDTAAADPHPARTKLILFAHEDWPEAARVVLALERLGYVPRVEPEWRGIFGAERTLDPATAREQNDVSVWRVRMATYGPDWITVLP